MEGDKVVKSKVGAFQRDGNGSMLPEMKAFVASAYKKA